MATAAFDRLSLTGDSGSPERKALDSSTIEILRKVLKGISAEKLDILDQRLKALDPRKTGSVITSNSREQTALSFLFDLNNACLWIRLVTIDEFKEAVKAGSWSLSPEDLSRLCQVYSVNNKISWTDLIKDICNSDSSMGIETEASGAFWYTKP
jgi:hypothetical protein